MLTHAGNISLKTSKASIRAMHQVLHKFTSFVLPVVPTGNFQYGLVALVAVLGCS